VSRRVFGLGQREGAPTGLPTVSSSARTVPAACPSSSSKRAFDDRSIRRRALAQPSQGSSKVVGGCRTRIDSGWRGRWRDAITRTRKRSFHARSSRISTSRSRLSYRRSPSSVSRMKPLEIAVSVEDERRYLTRALGATPGLARRRPSEVRLRIAERRRRNRGGITSETGHAIRHEPEITFEYWGPAALFRDALLHPSQQRQQPLLWFEEQLFRMYRNRRLERTERPSRFGLRPPRGHCGKTRCAHPVIRPRVPRGASSVPRYRIAHRGGRDRCRRLRLSA
jgi:hypothetical protein